MIIENFGAGARCAETLRLLLSAEAEGRIPGSVKRAVLLPIPTTRDKVHLSGTDRLLGEIFADVGEGDLVAGYGIDADSKSSMRERGAVVYDALDDEEFLTVNAELTAIGALGYILSSRDTAPSETRFAIIGYGRIGSRLLRLLLFLGGKVTVYSGNEQTCLRLGESGVDCRFMPRGAPLPENDADIIINTAPTDLSLSFSEGRIPKDKRVIELASGENFKGISGVERLPGIPDKSYGKSAGLSYFEGILRYAKEVTK